jgi:hypothetical protein
MSRATLLRAFRVCLLSEFIRDLSWRDRRHGGR